MTISFDGLPFLGEGPFEFAFYQEKEEEIWGEVAQVPLTVRLDNLQRSPRRTPYPVPIALFLDIPKGLVPQRSADLWPVLPVGADTCWPEASACRITVRTC